MGQDTRTAAMRAEDDYAESKTAYNASLRRLACMEAVAWAAAAVLVVGTAIAAVFGNAGDDVRFETRAAGNPAIAVAPTADARPAGPEEARP